MAITTGQQAPSFTLISSDRKPVSLEEFRGKKLVLLFYPGAYSGKCTEELCALQDDLAWYNDLGVQVIGVSTDTFFVLKQFKEDKKLDFILLSDYNKEVCGMYGAQYEEWIEGMKGTAKRSAFVIDENGNVTYAEVLDDALQIPDFDAVKAALS